MPWQLSLENGPAGVKANGKRLFVLHLNSAVPCCHSSSSEVRGAPPSPLTYAKTAKIRGGGTPHAKISTSLSFGGQQLNDSLGENQVLEVHFPIPFSSYRVDFLWGWLPMDMNVGITNFKSSAGSLTKMYKLRVKEVNPKGGSFNRVWENIFLNSDRAGEGGAGSLTLSSRFTFAFCRIYINVW